MSQIIIPAIDEDGSVFPIEKMEAHRQGQLHLALSVFVFSPDGRLLVQQRAWSKYHCGGQWANTCCSHPHWNEDLPTAAARRLHEELGFSVPLTPVGSLIYKADVGGGLTEHEHVHLFRGTANPQELTVRLEPSEVEAVAWQSIPDLAEMADNNPEAITPWFRIYLRERSDMWVPAA
ncbi:MAG: isopentenyl-diphosphate Delta-isomerase [Pseudomonadota bacterium]